MSLCAQWRYRNYKKLKKFCDKEKRAKQKYLREIAKQKKKKSQSKSTKKVTKHPKEQKSIPEAEVSDDEKICRVNWKIDQCLGRIRVQCNKCNCWVHSACSSCLLN